MTPNWVVVVSGAVVSSALGFLFAVLGLIVSQRYQRWLDCRNVGISAAHRGL